MSYTARGGVSWRHTTQRDTQREVEALFDDCCDTARVQRGLACEEAVGETRRCKATRRDVRALYGIIYTPECEKQVTDDSTDSHSAQTPGTFHDFQVTFQTCHRGARLCLVVPCHQPVPATLCTAALNSHTHSRTAQPHCTAALHSRVQSFTVLFTSRTKSSQIGRRTEQHSVTDSIKCWVSEKCSADRRYPTSLCSIHTRRGCLY